MADLAADFAAANPGLDNSDVVTKYIESGKIANEVLAKVAAAAVAGATVLDLCKLGDDGIVSATAKVYTKKVEGQAIPKGIAFPTCVSVNNVVCHFSPLQNEAAVTLKNGDTVKIDLGVHLDGYPTFVATTLTVGESKDNVITGRQADVVLAAHTALEVALRLVKPGNTNTQVTDAIQKATHAFNTNAIEGMLSYQISRFTIDDEKSIILNPSESTKKTHSECTFGQNEAYSIDVLVSTGTGKTKDADTRPTVYKRGLDDYSVKLKASKAFLSEVNKRFTEFPFTLRAFENETHARLAANECVTHRVIDPFPVLFEKDGEFVAQFKATILVTATNVIRVTEGPFDASHYTTTHTIPDDAKAFLQTPIGNPKKTKKTKATDAAAPAN